MTEDTQRKTTSPMSLKTRRNVITAQWLLEQASDPPRYTKNDLEVLICGKDAFTRIVEDLKKAQASVEIICWGFDPAMELTRNDGTVWPRGETWGGLLRDVALGKFNGGKPVQVRVLSWYGFIGSRVQGNMPGYDTSSRFEVRQAVDQGMAAALMPGGRLPPAQEPTDPRDKRETFNARWYRDAFHGDLKNIAIRTRDGDMVSVWDSLKDEAKRGICENLGMVGFPTDHQKTILIDYEHEGGKAAVGFVMGLNSVTDYWDSAEHLFHDPRRGEDWEGDTKDGRPGLKPYQDYACRIRGQALVAVSKNFTDAWNRAKCNGAGCGAPLARAHDLKNPPAGLSTGIEPSVHGTQIVRTQPEEGDKSIKRLYKQASSWAGQYVYIENQYFQYTQWVQDLKANREETLKWYQDRGVTPAEVPALHVMAVIPTPEKEKMVPRTYDTVRALGYGQNMPNQDDKIEDELKAHAQWDAYASEKRAKGEAPNPYLYPGEMSDLAKSAKAVGDEANIAKNLAAMGMRTLVGSLWTYNHDWRAQQSQTVLGRLQQTEGKGFIREKLHEHYQNQLDVQRYREIYIHSKLMIIDDAMFTLGSANLNQRSMAVDAEINVATDNPIVSGDLRRRVWGLHTGGTEKCNPDKLEPKLMADAFRRWQDLMAANRATKKDHTAPKGFLFPFEDKRTSSIRVG